MQLSFTIYLYTQAHLWFDNTHQIVNLTHDHNDLVEGK